MFSEVSVQGWLALLLQGNGEVGNQGREFERAVSEQWVTESGRGRRRRERNRDRATERQRERRERECLSQ